MFFIIDTIPLFKFIVFIFPGLSCPSVCIDRDQEKRLQVFLKIFKEKIISRQISNCRDIFVNG